MLCSISNLARLGAGLAMTFGIAAAADKPTDDPEALLRGIRSRAMAHLSQLPNYMCRQVVNRMVRPAGSTLGHQDTVELEVAFVGREELFSKPGESRFGERSITELAPGTIGNGVLGSQIDMLFASDAAEFRFGGTSKKDGHKTYRFDLMMPQEKSGFRVKHGGAEAIVAYEGSVWVDVETLEMVRVDLKIKQIPASVGVRWIEKSMHYELMNIAGTDFLMPRKSELAATDDVGNYSLNLISLDQCREFTGQSTITYGAPAPGTSPQGSASREKVERREQ
uniref:Outer membrane lipoprotein-sorting protein n=1 Tax=Solibacter usitatus (strain Ellin6076) TaxID=234267 RepID=Q01XI0_SOLUE